MKVWRKVQMDVSDLQVGDKLEINLNGFGLFTATVHKVDGDKALLIFDNCIADRAMNKTNTNEGGFASSGLCRWLNTVFMDALPDKIRKRLVVDDAHDGLMIRIPTRGEVFGHDDSSKNYERDDDAQLPLMKDRKNRICISPEDEYCWYWIANTKLDSAASFADVRNYGVASCNTASGSIGVRPVFTIRIRKKKKKEVVKCVSD